MKTGTKRLFLSTLASVLLFPGQAFAADPAIELNLWTHEDPARSVLEKKLIAEFQAANPNVTVKYVTYPSGKIKDIVVTAFAANQGPDIFNLEIQDEYPLIANGRVAPVDLKAIGVANQKALTDQYSAGIFAPVTEGGKVYGLPLEVTNWAIFLNKKIFRDAGLNPEKDYPKTWEDVVAVSEKLVVREGEIIKRRGFDFRYPYYLTQFVPMVEQLGGALTTPDGRKAIVNDEAWIKFLTFLRDFGPSGKNLGSPTYTAARNAFNGGKDIAMAESGLYQEARILAANPDFYNSGDWMVIPYPQFKDAKKKVTGNFYGHFYMVNAQKPTATQAAAWKLVSFLLSHSEDYLREVKIVQPLKKLLDSKTFKDMPYSDVFRKDLEAAQTVYYAENSPKVNDLLKVAVESVMLNKVEPKAALETLKRNLQAALDDQQ